MGRKKKEQTTAEFLAECEAEMNAQADKDNKAEKVSNSKIGERTCKWCGKTFVPPNGHRHYCSEECHKAIFRAYNTKYQTSRRARLPEASLDRNRKLAYESWARKSWRAWEVETVKLLKLANSEDPSAAITKYLSDHYRPRGKNQTPPDLSSLEEARKADEIIAKLIGE